MSGNEKKKLRPWKTISKIEKRDINKILKIKEDYEELLDQDSLDYNEDYKRLSDLVFDLEEAQASAFDELDRDEQEERRIEAYVRILENQEIYYITERNRYVEYFEDEGVWKFYSADAIARHMGQTDKATKDAFQLALIRLGKSKIDTRNTFKKVPDRTLNMMRQRHWLQINEINEKNGQGGAYNHWFDILMKSLSNGNKEIQDHLEQCVIRKYIEPGDYQIPCIVWYGHGGAGKNIFVKDMLGTIFGNNQVRVLKSKSVFGDFTGQLLGAAIIYIDEQMKTQGDAANARSIVGNETIDVNEKYAGQGIYENTAWYLTGANDNKSASKLLDGTSADRRWSLIRLDKSVISRVCEWYNIPYQVALDGDKGYDKGIDLWEENRWIFNDKKEVGRWLTAMYYKWAQIVSKRRPPGYHEEDYHRMQRLNVSAREHFLMLVFLDKNFTYIPKALLYKGYKEYINEYNSSQKHRMQERSKFEEEVDDWIKRNNIDISARNIKVKGLELGGKTPIKMGDEMTHKCSAWAKNRVGTYENIGSKYEITTEYNGRKFDVEALYEQSIGDYDPNHLNGKS